MDHFIVPDTIINVLPPERGGLVDQIAQFDRTIEWALLDGYQPDVNAETWRQVAMRRPADGATLLIVMVPEEVAL